MKDLHEELAAWCHEQWSHWMKYLFEKCPSSSSGHRLIPMDYVNRWVQQMHTPYDELPPAEKLSDISQAEKLIALLRKMELL